MPFLYSRLVSIPSKLLWRFPKGSSTMMKRVPNSQQHTFEGVVWVLERYLHTLVHDPNWNFMEFRWPTSVYESALGRFADPLLKVDSDSRTVWVLWCLPIHIKYHKSRAKHIKVPTVSKFNYTMTTPMIDKLLFEHIIRSISDLYPIYPYLPIPPSNRCSCHLNPRWFVTPGPQLGALLIVLVREGAALTVPGGLTKQWWHGHWMSVDWVLSGLTLPKNKIELHAIPEVSWTYGTVSSGFCSPGNHATNLFNKITQKLTWNPMQAQTKLLVFGGVSEYIPVSSCGLHHVTCHLRNMHPK